MQKIELNIEERDIPVIALSALGGFFLVIIALAGRDMAAGVFVGSLAGASSGAGGGVLACIFRKFLENKGRDLMTIFGDATPIS
jgi:hypothetical protein